jgi:hypothetical protein
MRSYEYLKVSGPRKTELLVVEGIQFHVANQELNHSSIEIFEGDIDNLTLKYQKNADTMQSKAPEEQTTRSSIQSTHGRPS